MGGPPTAAGRRLSTSLSRGLGCRICQQLLNSLWGELPQPSIESTRSWLSQGCSKLVKRYLLKEGWSATSGEHCGGAGTHATDGHRWCFLQDPTADALKHPLRLEEYDPASDSLIRACRGTLEQYRERI